MRSLRKFVVFAVVACCGSLGVGAESAGGFPASTPADAIVASVADHELYPLLIEVLDRNPEIAALESRVAAADFRSVSVRKLPDPRVELTAFVLPPETRVGPQRAAARITQQLPGGGKRALAAKTEEFGVDALVSELETLRLRLVTETRTLAVELVYLDQAMRLLEDELITLERFEELARTRYASGVGLQMEAIKIHAEISRLETRRSELAARRAAVSADLNRLRDRPGLPLPPLGTLATEPPQLSWPVLRETALAARPELAAADAAIRRSSAAVDLAAKRGSPDFSIGLSYAWIDRRTDIDVPDNGRDVLGLNGGLTIPIWSSAVAAEVEGATRTRIAAEATRRTTVGTIERQLEDLRGRIPELVRRLDLLENVLQIQTEQALASAEAAYVAGRVDALALLDAERTLVDVRLAAARGRADLAVALIALEGAIAAPLPAGAPS
jgi:outer membrane protein TolC